MTCYYVKKNPPFCAISVNGGRSYNVSTVEFYNVYDKESSGFAYYFTPFFAFSSAPSASLRAVISRILSRCPKEIPLLS